MDVTCTRTEAALDQWRLDTYGALVNAHANLVGVYQDKLKARAVQAATVTSLGQNTTQNRLIERTELKKACISRLAATDLYLANFDDISVHGTAPAFPRPSVPMEPNPLAHQAWRLCWRLLLRPPATSALAPDCRARPSWLP